MCFVYGLHINVWMLSILCGVGVDVMGITILGLG